MAKETGIDEMFIALAPENWYYLAEMEDSVIKGIHAYSNSHAAIIKHALESPLEDVDILYRSEGDFRFASWSYVE